MNSGTVGLGLVVILVLVGVFVEVEVETQNRRSTFVDASAHISLDKNLGGG